MGATNVSCQLTVSDPDLEIRKGVTGPPGHSPGSATG